MTVQLKKTMEFEGKTLTEAIKAACDYFGTSENNLDIQVLSKPTPGIFGLGGKKCRILVTYLGQQSEDEKEKVELTTDKASATTNNKENSRESLNDNNEDNDSLNQIEAEEHEIHVHQSEFVEEEEDEETISDVVTEEELKKYLNETKIFVDRLFELAGFDVTTSIKHDDKGAFIDMTGNDINLVIGRDGVNLDALTYLVNRIARDKAKKQLTIRLDADGYRRRHEIKIIEIAERLANRAKQTGRQMILSPLSPKDRRLVHIHLRNIGGVRTVSLGDGVYKKIAIIPIRQRRRQRRYDKGYESRDRRHHNRQNYSRDRRDYRESGFNNYQRNKNPRFKKNY